MIILQNDRIFLSLSKSNGAVLQLKDRMQNIDYIHSDSAIPFELDYGNGFIQEFRDFSWAFPDPESHLSVLLSWKLKDGTILEAEVSLQEDSVSFRSRLHNTADDGSPFTGYIKYPFLQGIQVLDSEKSDYLFHPYATGVLIEKPFEVFSGEQNGFSQMPYPECYSGCSMQFLAYYSCSKGGIYIAALDSEENVKWLNFYKEENAFAFSQIYGYTNNAAWPLVIKFMSGRHDWYEAADLYREWAVRQKWCAKGRLADIPSDKKPVWLLEHTGAATFGINAMYDRTLWLNKYSETLQTPIFHITGPDWPKELQDYHNHLCGGYDDWFPSRFHPENLAAIKKNHDFFAPFEFDFFANMEGADSENLKKSLMVNPEHKYSLDSYPFTILCPTLPYTQKLHRERDMTLQKESDCDALYYDISANNLLHLCVNPEHSDYHPIGGNQSVTRGFCRVFQDTKDAVSRQAGKYVPIGTELMNEVFLEQLDYYQARSWSQPCGYLETLYFRDWIKSGSMKMVPAFTYVYHEYGGIRIDGWGKLTDAIGDLFYHTVAKTYLWGALYELNYEYSPLEMIDGKVNPQTEHYFSFTPRECPFSEEKAAYLAQYAALRTGPLNKYLAYGKMQEPAAFANKKIDFTYFQYNASQISPEYEDRGIIREDAVIHSIWEYEDPEENSVALFFANTSEDDFYLHLKLPAQYQHYTRRELFSRFEPKTDCQISLLDSTANSYEILLKGRRVSVLRLS